MAIVVFVGRLPLLNRREWVIVDGFLAIYWRLIIEKQNYIWGSIRLPWLSLHIIVRDK